MRFIEKTDEPAGVGCAGRRVSKNVPGMQGCGDSKGRDDMPRLQGTFGVCDGTNLYALWENDCIGTG